MPEIALFKDVRHSGRAELQVYAIGAESGKFVDKSAPAAGTAQYDNYTVLLVINFTRTDIDNRAWNWAPDLA